MAGGTPKDADKATEEKPKERGLELGIYLSWVKTELDNESACLELPFTLVLLVSFSILALYHLKQSSTFVVEGSWTFDIQENANFAWSHNFGHKTVHDVNSIADFWSWFRIGFLPLVVQHSWSFSEGLDDAYTAAREMGNISVPFNTSQLPSEYSLLYGKAEEPWTSATLPVRDGYLHYNRIVAGIRLRQERATASWESCELPDTVSEAQMKAWLGKPCMPASPSYELTPEVSHAEAFAEPQRVEWMLTSRQSLKDLQMKALDMEDGCSLLAEKGRVPPTDEPYSMEHCLCQTCKDAVHLSPGGPLRPGPWLDELTQRVEIGIVGYNQNYGLISLVTVNLFINRGGHFYKVIHVQSAWADEYQDNPLELVLMIACDVVWLSALTWVCVNEVREILSVVRASKQNWYTSILSDYLAFWNCVDWISIICAYAVFGCYLRLFVETGTAKASMEVIAAANQTNLTRAESEALSEDVFEKVETMVMAEADFRFMLAFYPIVVMLRLFKSFDAQPRLAVVTKTLTTAAPDMTHFFVVFFSVYVCMAVNGVLLFGQDLEEFATIDRSIITCFRAMFGEWNWERMASVGRRMATVWISTWVLLVVVLLLNMLLAILMDAYAVVKSKAANMTSLPEQISELMRRRRQFVNKERVRLTDIWDSYFEKIGDEKEMVASKELITAEDIIKQVTGIPPKQARRTIANAQKQLDESLEAPYTQDDFKEQLSVSKSRVKMLCDEVRTMRINIEQHRAQLTSLPQPMDAGIKESTTHILDIVNANVDILSKQVQEVLLEESDTVEDRTGELCTKQKEILKYATEVKRNLELMNDRVQKVTSELQVRAARKEMNQAMKPASMLSRLGLVCAAPATAADKETVTASPT